ISGIVIFLVGAAGGFSWMLAAEQVPSKLGAIMTSISNEPWVFFAISMAIFIVLGAILEGLPTLIICMPIFMPIATGLGIDPLHYATITIAALGIGMFLPPIGTGLYIAASFANLTMAQMIRPMMPYILVLCVGLL